MPKDVYKYFRVEARELVEELSRCTLELEKGPPADGLIPRMLRLSHTLKGAARVVKELEITDAAHAIEDLLAPLRGTTSEIRRTSVDQLLKLIDKISGRVAALMPPSGGPRTGETIPSDEFRTVRADIAEIDALLDGISESHLQLANLREEISQLDRARRLTEALNNSLNTLKAGQSGSDSMIWNSVHPLAMELREITSTLQRTITTNLDRIDREMVDLRDGVERLRLVPVSVVLGGLERIARDTGQATNRRILFEITGADNRMDAHVLSVVQTALVQVVRNAVAHGIESEGDRLARGKPPEGRISIRVNRRGERMSFSCRDDGQGMDVVAISEIARRKGLLAAETDNSVEKLLHLLLEGGISTSERVTEVAGRGIGFDVIREATAKLGGKIDVSTEAGKGTLVEINVPVSFSSMRSLLVEASGTIAALPLDSVYGAIRIGPGDVARTPEGDTVLYEGSGIPVVPLARLLKRSLRRTSVTGRSSAVVVHADRGVAAVSVDRLIGTSNIVLRSLPRLAPANAVVAGICLDAGGNPQLVLNTEGLVERAQRTKEVSDSDVVSRLPILVVDDSLTTRMLEQSILESAGYKVDLAVSGEEALNMAYRERYGLFLVDVEMPGMDGFTFVERTQKDPLLREIPSILVTSRSSAEDRRRGEEAGAQGYVVKSEFNQNDLLERIKVLIG